MADGLENNIALWRERIGNASAKWGGAEICAVTKTVDVDTINRAYAAGIRVIGENRVQKMNEKVDRLHPGFELHMIGALQTNKVKILPDRVKMVQSVDRLALAEALEKRKTQQNANLPVLIEVNIAKEPQKSGVYVEELRPLLKEIAQMERLAVQGLMTVMPAADDPETIRPLFREMRALFERIRDWQIPRVQMNVLSMGMSHDCIVAAEEGATMVRLGRALFGERPARP